MAIHIIEEADRCLNCKRPLCQLQGCPVATHIPEVISLFKERRLEEAGALLFGNNPMSAVCAIVCNHSKQCEGACVRGRKGTPVHFSSIESYISGTYLDRMVVKRPEPNGRRVAVVGSGPAGITVALGLAQRGCAVTIFEQRTEIGGVLEYGIPDFRLPRQLVQKYRSILCALGVRVRPSTTIGGALRLDDLLADGYDSIFVGTGTWRAKKLGIPGESRGNVIYGIDYLVNPQSFAVGERVAVIGVGNVAMDVARSAIREGAREVTLYARSRHVSASSDEIEYAELDGAQIVYGKAIEAIDENGPVFKTAIFGEEDKVTGYEDALDHVAADTVVIAASQAPKDKLVLTTSGLEPNERGLLVVDDAYQTTVPGIFAAGDVVTGAKTVVHAVAGAKEAADAMLAYMGLAGNEDAAAEERADGEKVAAR